MIESITIKDFATYSRDTPQKLEDLSKVNFLFGSNGAGKTVISQIIDNESKFSECEIAWKGGIKLETMVYNRYFVERNFSQTTEIKGVFTLGEEQKETLEEISSKKKEMKDLEIEIERLTLELQGDDDISGEKGKLAEIETKFKDYCWDKKQQYDNKFKDSFQGFRDTKEKFKEEILGQKNRNNAELLAVDKLEEKAKIVFGTIMETQQKIPNINTVSILSHEANEILKKKVIGKEDVDIAAMIKTLGNSDWVQEGREFYDVNNEVCPFCQQKTDKEFSDSLNKYFGKAFKSDAKAIEDIKANYIKDADKIQEIISSLVHNPSEFLKVEELKSKQEILKTEINFNNQKIVKKQKEPSQIVKLDSLANTLEAINGMIDTANQKITAHNNTVDNIKTERKNLTSQVWRFVVNEMKYEIEKFEEEKNNLNNIMAEMEKNIKNAKECRNAKLKDIQELENKTTSVQPTINNMNHLLTSFGFKGFKFAKEGETSYKIIRLDGTDAKDTLSEGERNFVTFLYFYHLIKGSASNSGMTTDRIVVFDDPVSSIDSDILWIVSSLIRDLFEKTNKENEHIKQIFVFTHNVYFHKEVSFEYPNTEKDEANCWKFWMIRKPEQYSEIKKCSKNPVQSTYQLLWEEVKQFENKKEGEKYSDISIQNTLRRILECYFKILGGVNFNKLYEEFDDERDKIIYKSLISWVNDGSHFADESMEISSNDANIDTYLGIFREVFCKLGHKAHYTMMMSIPINKPADE